ncbi:MAG TPA: succinylglutamate desuccinylase/aspartoacylase family protein [Acidimicrobiia bacterium]|nr:succinylglutamate desuccinylase/aspartoacylase family protein [Acidimicrobiia bacterium]
MVPEKVNDPITVGDVTVRPGRKVQIELPFARVVTGATESLPVKVINGRSAGPNVWLSAAIHGDELNGIQIIRRVIKELDAKNLRGAVIAVPIVNPLGFIIQSRYLPDRRDLNRSFPGSARGSTAARLAHLFMEQVVDQCTVGFDLHTATNHRINHPQIRANLDDATTLRLARAFAAPFSIHAKLRDGSLRQAAAERGKTVLLYEGGQANRFDDEAVDRGVLGIMRTLRSMGMIDVRLPRVTPTTLIRRTRWMRARRGGIADIEVKLGDYVSKGETVASISDAFGSRPTQVRSTESGWVLARSLRPLVNSGDSLVHVATETGPDRDEPAERKRKTNES